MRRIEFLPLLSLVFYVAFTPVSGTELSYEPRNAKGIYGFAPYLDGTSQINLVNGNALFARHVVTRPGRGGFKFDLYMFYNSKIWDRSGSDMVVVDQGSPYGLGWRVGLFELVEGTSSYALISPDGSSHEIVDYGGGNWKSVDSTYILFDPATKVATMKGGARITFGLTSGSRSYVTLMTDRNGNQITFSYVSGTTKIRRINDTIGALAIFTYDTEGFLMRVNTYGQPNTALYFTYQNASLNPAFGIPSQIPSGEKFLKEIYVKDGWKDLMHQFTYNNYGEISWIKSVVVEHGYDSQGNFVETGRDTKNVELLTWRTLSFYDPTYGTVEERLVDSQRRYVYNPGGLSVSIYYITYTLLSGDSNPSKTNISISGDNRDYFLNYTANGRNWSDGLVSKYEVRDGANVLQKVDTTWTQDDTNLSGLLNPRATSHLTTLENGLSTTLDITYTTDGTGNVKEATQHDFNGAPLLKKVFTYLHETNTAYSPLNLTHLVDSVSVQDGAGTELDRTELRYDETVVTEYVGGIYNHDGSYDSTYTTRGNRTSTKRYLAEELRWITASTTYDETGNVLSSTDALNNTTGITYWSGAAYALPKIVTNPLSQVTEYVWETTTGWIDGLLTTYATGNPKSQKDPNNVLANEWWFDFLGRMTKHRTPAETKTFSYSPMEYLSTIANAGTYEYGGYTPNGRVNTNELDDPTDGNIIRETSHDGDGRITSRTLPHRVGTSGGSDGYTYDALGRVIQVNPAITGGMITYQYTGNETLVTDQEGAQKKYVYDDLGRMVSVFEEDSGGGLTLETSYTYALLGRLTQITQGVQSRTFSYDSLGRLLSETHPENGTITYSYNDNGNLVSTTDARGVTTTLAYDTLNRQTSRTYSDGSPSSTFTYDETSSTLIGTIAYGTGRMTSAWTSDGIGYSWSFDEEGRPVQQMFQLEGTNYNTTYDYTDDGCGCTKKDLISMTYPGGFQIDYTRDAFGRPTKVAQPVTGLGYSEYPYVSEVQFSNSDGSPSMIELGDLVRTLLTQSSGKVTQLEIKDWVGTNLIRWNYSYTSSGRIYNVYETRKAVPDPNIQQRQYYYTYDEAYRLSNARREDLNFSTGLWDVTWDHTFTYDRYNNMLSATKTYAAGGNQNISFTVDTNTNRMTQDFVTANNYRDYTYDATGNVIAQTGSSYQINGAGRMVQATRTSDNGDMGTYRYDAFGRRVKKSWNYPSGAGTESGSVISVYGASGELLVDYKDINSINGIFEDTTHYYVQMNGVSVAKRIQGSNQAGSVDKIEFWGRNHLGEIKGTKTVNLLLMGGCDTPSIWYLCDNDLVTYALSEPFGENGDDQFQGHKTDSGTGLHYKGARYFTPSGMRWMSVDPVINHLSNPHRLNRYTYNLNDPINWVDPDGKEPFLIQISVTHELPGESTRWVFGKRGSHRPFGVPGGRNLDIFAIRTFAAATFLKETLSLTIDSDECGAIFSTLGVDPQQFLDAIDTLGFEDGTTSDVKIEDVMNKPWARAKEVLGWTVARLFAENFPGSQNDRAINAFTPPEGPYVFIRPSAIDPALIGHELFHKFGLFDDDLLGNFGLDPDGPSSQFTDMFNRVCLGGK